jgi:hypothetical protein
MTELEAKVFLSHQDADNLKDAYDLVLFDQKQFFLTKPIVPKVFFARIEKMQKVILAAEVLGFSEQTFIIDSAWSLNETDVFRDWVAQFEKLKNEWKKQLSACTSLVAVSVSVNQFLIHFKDFTSKWPDFPDLNADVKFSIEPDPMTLLEEMQRFNAMGIVTFTDLLHDKSSSTDMLKKESVRLHRLNKMF